MLDRVTDLLRFATYAVSREKMGGVEMQSGVLLAVPGAVGRD